MKPWRLPWALWGVLLGALLQLQQAVLWPAWAYAACLVVGLGAAAGVWRGPWRRVQPPLLLGLVALALWGGCGLRALEFRAQALAHDMQGRDVRVQGVIASMVQSSELGWRFRFAVEAAQWQGVAVPLPPLVELAWYARQDPRSEHPLDDGAQAERGAGPPSALRPGQRWALTVRLTQPHGARNPHGFDYELWLWEQGVQATGVVRTGKAQEDARLLQASWRYPVEQLRQRVRDAIVLHLAQPPPEPAAAAQRAAAQRAAGVVAALVTGDQRAIDRSDWDLFRATGVSHLMSISGLHITLFAWLAQAVVGWGWRRSARLCLWWPAQQAALLAGLGLAGGYALFSGWGLPAQRTVLMLAVVCLLRLSGRRWPWGPVWLLACAAVVLADPWALLQAGFWLSFVAVGILFASNFIAACASPVRLNTLFYLVFGPINRLVREQWVMTLALTPLTLLLFGQISLVSFLANALAIGWVTLVVTPLALLGVLWPPLWSLAATAVAPLVGYLQFLAAWPWATLALPAPAWWAACAAVAGGCLLALRWPWQVRSLGLVLLVPALCWQPQRPALGAFSVLAADVGQGSAVLIRTAHHALLYDAGPRYGLHSSAGERVLVPLLHALGVRLDTLLLSHADSDHTGGAPALRAAQPGVLVRGWSGAAPSPAAIACAAGQHWEWDQVQFTLLHPEPASPEAPTRPVRTNASSCVLQVRSRQGVVALLAGDIERAQERALHARGAPLKADWVLVPHHGSASSSSPTFVHAVAPRWALVQAGYRNRFGHPQAEVLERWRSTGAQVVATPACGAALWQSDRPEHLECERTAHRRYWQRE